MGLLYICKYRVPLGLSVYQLRALRLLHLMRNGVLCIFTFGPLGPVTFDLWGQDGQKALLRGRAHKCTTYGPQGLCSFSASLDRMMCLMGEGEGEGGELEGYIFVHKYGYTRILSVYPNLQSLFAEDLK